MPSSEQRGPVVVYGASGYTGRLVVAELVRRRAEVVLSGRDEGRLRAVAESVGGSVAVQPAPLHDEAQLRLLLADAAAVIACAGPFVDLGEPIVRAAVETRTHYLDTTGEQPFIRMVLERHGPRAEERGVALVPGMGFDYAPGDLLAALVANGMGALEEIVVAYHVTSFGPSRGTMLSALRMMSGGDVEWRDGDWREASGSVDRGTWEFPSPLGRQRMTRYPAGEQVMVPRHVDVQTVRTMLNASAFAPHPVAAAAMIPSMAVLQRIAASPARRAIDAVVPRLPEGPAAADRRRARFTIDCSATGVAGSRRGTLEGSDVYGLTAVTTAEGAARMSEPGFDRAGGLAPAEAFEPSGFLDALAPSGVTWLLEPVPARRSQA